MPDFWRLGLLGDPVDHSLSPALQSAALKAAGLQGEYRLLQTPAGTLAERLPELADEDYVGLNVTVPLKEECFRVLFRSGARREAPVSASASAVDAPWGPSALGATARELGAINTLVRTGGGWTGHNTDPEGCQRALRGFCGELRGKRAVILGAGGAARAVLMALLASGVRRVEIWNRSAGRLARLMEEFSPRADEAELIALETDREHCPADVDLIVQATSLGLTDGDPLPLLPAPGRRPPVMDLVTRFTPWMAACIDAGCEARDGREMLLWQGAAAFHHWTGRQAPLAAMREALFCR